MRTNRYYVIGVKFIAQATFKKGWSFVCDLKKAVGRKHSGFGLEDIQVEAATCTTSTGCHIIRILVALTMDIIEYPCFDTALKAPVPI